MMTLDWVSRPQGARRYRPWLLAAGAAGATILVLAIAGPDRDTVVHNPAAPVHTPMAAPLPPLPPTAASFAQPVPGYPVISPFGLRQLPWESHARLHAGVDIMAPLGAPVRAVAAGVVARAGVDSGYGRFVEIRHPGGISSFYAHLGAMADGLKAGVAVPVNAVIGQVGSTGASTGAHLHFAVYDAQRRPMNPDFFIGKVYQTARDWPLAAARKISSVVRIAYVSNIPLSKRELMIAMQEQGADEQETRDMEAREHEEEQVMVVAAVTVPAEPVAAELTIAPVQPIEAIETAKVSQQADLQLLVPPSTKPRATPRLAISE